ncbi:hypothetical protein CK203_056820 [Vitis vinifera]|uniref:Mitochondrial protein n=1 Tax=Vitis vinifera TaxID=29760 RepID=A0A438GQA1_VITVI|nr:hypothetical protein CK203_056820 [Vitis vinifera]
MLGKKGAAASVENSAMIASDANANKVFTRKLLEDPWEACKLKSSKPSGKPTDASSYANEAETSNNPSALSCNQNPAPWIIDSGASDHRTSSSYLFNTYLSCSRSDDIAELERLKKGLAKNFKIEGLGALKYFLGMEFNRSKEGIFVTQHKYTLARTSLGCNQDADWTGSITDRKSTSSYCTFVGGNLVTWRSKKQNIVAKIVLKLNLDQSLMEFVKLCESEGY